MFALAEARSKPADGFLRTAARVVQDGAEAARPVSGFGSTSNECARPPASLPIEQPISPLCHRKLGDITIGNQARDGSKFTVPRCAIDGELAPTTVVSGVATAIGATATRTREFGHVAHKKAAQKAEALRPRQLPQLSKTRRSISLILLTPVSAMVTSSSLRMISMAVATPAWPPAPRP